MPSLSFPAAASTKPGAASLGRIRASEHGPARHGAAIVIPIRSFVTGKERLADALTTSARVELVRRMAEGVVRAAVAVATRAAVVTRDPDVSAWARGHGLDAVDEFDDPGGLDGAATAGRAWAERVAAARVVIVHADLPYIDADALTLVGGDACPDRVAAAPCRRDDGTPVLSVPVGAPFRFAYGPGSFRRHAAESRRLGLAFRAVRDPRLSLDVDVAEDVDSGPAPGRRPIHEGNAGRDDADSGALAPCSTEPDR